MTSFGFISEKPVKCEVGQMVKPIDMFDAQEEKYRKSEAIDVFNWKKEKNFKKNELFSIKHSAEN